MINEDYIYCVGCHHILKKEKAGKVFRTGFYKCDMHLGICLACSETELEESVVCIQESEEPSYIAVEPL